LFLGIITLSFSGCVTQLADSSPTASGKPEVVIASRDVDSMKSSLTREMASFGYQVDQDTPNLLEISRTTTDLITTHAFGDADSAHKRVVDYTFLRQGVFTKVTADVSVRARSPEGQVETMSLNNNGAVYGFVQQQLEKLKEALE